MDLSLLHAVTYGYPCFGRWGYRFCHGSFGVIKQNSKWAIDILSSLELDKIITDFAYTKQYRDVKQIMNSYRDLSETQLITIRDLLRFSLTLKSEAPPQRKSATAATVSSSSSKRTALQNKPIVKERPESWLNLIMNCVTSPSLYLLWNGEKSDPFKRAFARVLSVSFFCFVPLSFWKLLTVKNRGHFVQAGVVLLYLTFFADDLVLFGEATCEQAEIIMECLEAFESWSGQKERSLVNRSFFFSH